MTPTTDQAIRQRLSEYGEAFEALTDVMRDGGTPGEVMARLAAAGFEIRARRPKITPAVTQEPG